MQKTGLKCVVLKMRIDCVSIETGMHINLFRIRNNLGPFSFPINNLYTFWKNLLCNVFRSFTDPVKPLKEQIEIDLFNKMDLRVCEIVKCQEIRKSNHCVKLTVIF